MITIPDSAEKELLIPPGIGYSSVSMTEVISKTIDMILNKCSTEDWLKSLAQMMGADKAATISWVCGEPGENTCSFYNQPDTLQPGWMGAMDKLVASAQLTGSTTLEDLLLQADDPDPTMIELANNPHSMVGILAWEPAVIVVEVLRDEKWSITDRSSFAAYQHINKKFQELHKKHDRYRNTVNLANTIFNSSPRGMILLFETGELMAVNHAAALILEKNDGISVKQNVLVLDEAGTQSELIGALDGMKALKQDEIEQTRWFWSLQLKSRPHPIQLALQIIPIHEWRLESSNKSRVGLLFLNDPTQLDKPSIRQLQAYFNLTGAQANVALALWGGMGISEAADNLSISVNTARSHLRKIYHKVGARSHAELMSILTATMAKYTIRHKTTGADEDFHSLHSN